MAGFDENLVREYFELNGFFVRQLNKYQVHSRKKRAEEEIDLLVQNPRPGPAGRKPGFYIFSSELPLVRRAVVAVKGWHSSRVTPSMLRSGSKIADFLRTEVMQKAEAYFSEIESDLEGEAREPFLRILVLPGVPTAEPHRSETVALLQKHGVDAILTFPTILENLVSKVEVNYSYQKSDLLHVIRLFKAYDMIKPPQLDLFSEEKPATGRRRT